MRASFRSPAVIGFVLIMLRPSYGTNDFPYINNFNAQRGITPKIRNLKLHDLDNGHQTEHDTDFWCSRSLRACIRSSTPAIEHSVARLKA